MSTSKQSLHENYQKQFFELKTTKTVQTLLRRELENQTAHGQDPRTERFRAANASCSCMANAPEPSVREYSPTVPRSDGPQRTEHSPGLLQHPDRAREPSSPNIPRDRTATNGEQICPGAINIGRPPPTQPLSPPAATPLPAHRELLGFRAGEKSQAAPPCCSTPTRFPVRRSVLPMNFLPVF
jgi:hypothetical protein